MLLGAARYLAETRQFNGTVNFIFQPGERAWAAHSPCWPKAYSSASSDELMASTIVRACRLGISRSRQELRWREAHSSTSQSRAVTPHATCAPGIVIASCHICTALQTIVARNLPPADMGVLSVTKIDSGDAYNVIPERARMGGTVRAMTR
jgi:hippurate hydrolase